MFGIHLLSSCLPLVSGGRCSVTFPPPPGGGAKSVEVFQRGLSAVTLSHFVSHTELIIFLNYYHGIRFVGRKKIVVTTNVARSSTTFTLF